MKSWYLSISRWPFFFSSFLPLISPFTTWVNYAEDAARLKQPKPSTWSEKPMGQWCRNTTNDLHTQCPRASVAHEWYCCGESGAECCFAVQGWVYLLTGCILFVGLATLIFHLLLHFGVIWPTERKVELKKFKVIEEKPHLITTP
ncbi:unnamed protein product, partial [Mesorhabditis belari]|uniref:Uncharacterized protein n=1 Tax=Mesorhabditis belari TaxID=2138241 RepID=A0AAF3F6D9_9BILA